MADQFSRTELVLSAPIATMFPGLNLFSEESPVTLLEISEAAWPLVPVAMFQFVWVKSVPSSTSELSFYPKKLQHDLVCHIQM